MQILSTACNEHLHRPAECEKFKIVLGPVGKSITIIYHIVYLESHFRDTVYVRPFRRSQPLHRSDYMYMARGAARRKARQPPPPHRRNRLYRQS